MVFQSTLISSKHLMRTVSSLKGPVKGLQTPPGPGSGIVACQGQVVASFKSTTNRSFTIKADDPKFESILTFNKAWREKKLKEDPDVFKELGKEHKPDFLYIGCSDARVAVADLTGIKMGKLFVHRNIANMVVSSDLNLLSVLTYAIEHLNVKHILVTGHYDCGGIRASVKKQDFGSVLDAWLQNIRDVSRLHKDELDAIQDDEEHHRRLVELNVVEQCLNLYKTKVVQKKRLETHADKSLPFSYPRIHGLVFDPATGVLRKLDINYREKIAELHDVYDLFELEENNTHYMLKKEEPKKE
jgi:carbonic anhydrase